MAKVSSTSKNQKGELAASLEEATTSISSDQTVTFTLYVRLILPLDGFVFWVNANLLQDKAISTSLGLGTFAYPDNKKSVTVKGSFHHQAETRQEDISTRTHNHLIFTALSKVDVFNQVSPGAIWVGDIDGVPYTFSSMANRYKQAGLYHYRGDSIQPVMRSQMITSLDDFDPQKLVVSNSIPIFMALNQYVAAYPAQLVEPNLTGPYAVIDVRETRPLQMAPHVVQLPDGTVLRYQHVQDSVRITLLGLNNDKALNYLDHIITTAVMDEEFGITNCPVVIDDKLPQREIGALAMKKHIDFDINYYQQTARSIAMKLITSAFIDIEVS
ncbi:hypothetical protein [Serratia fonticola]|uniref:hypothetical protein n=1 Tax=Serratia fonticola TaxID=47917 RepID=UPI00301BFAD5